MQLSGFPFTVIEWSSVEAEQRPSADGGSGVAVWRTRRFGSVRVRLVEYPPGYASDHWCSKGHVVHVLRGEMRTVLADGRGFTLREGMTYCVADDAEPHRSNTDDGGPGATLLIVD